MTSLIPPFPLGLQEVFTCLFEAAICPSWVSDTLDQENGSYVVLFLQCAGVSVSGR